MRPLKVRMQGFGPFRDATEVDFTDVELVALMGTTGSGKSTILDAITFALFGRIARLDARAVAPVINALSPEARVSFDFELAGTAYTAVRIVRRTKTGASTKEARLECGVETVAASADDISEAVERLLGVDFDRFTKVAFLPQGKFADFLHDKPADRQRLLRELLGLAMYEQIGQAARKIASTAASQLEVLRPQLSDAGVTDEQIADLEATAADLRKLLDDVRVRLVSRTERVAELERQRSEAEDFAILTLAVDAVSVPAEVAELGARIGAADAELAAAEVALHDADAALARAVEARSEGPDTAWLERCRDGHRRLDTLTDRVVELDRAAVGARAEQAAAESAHSELLASVEAAASATRRAEMAEDAAEAAVTESRSSEAIEQDRRAHVRVAELAAAIERIEAPGGDLSEAEAQVERADEHAAEARTALRVAQDARREAEQTGHVAVLAGSLEAGDECPVCRRVIIELPDHEPLPELAAAQDAVERAERAADAAADVHAKATQSVAVVRSRLDDARAQLAEATAAAAGIATLDELDAEAAERTRLEQAMTAARALADEARRAERELREGDDAAAVAKRLRDATTASAAAESAVDGARATLAEVEASLADAPSAADVDEQLAVAAELADTERSAQAARREAAQAVEVARTSRSDIKEHEDRLRRRFGNVRDGFVGLDPPQPGHESLLADWEAFAAWADSLRAPLEAHHRSARARADATATELAAADAATVQLCAGLDDPPPPHTPIAELDGLLTRRVAGAEAEATSARSRQQQMARTRAQVEELEESAEVHELLGNQLRSSGFEQWLLDEVIQTLVERASERLFELSRGQYSIEAESMVFSVRDHRNGDERRDARTLSGGETFLASLALALALAESIAEMAPTDTPPMECLFLDEGFGTLDPETLDVVASAIEELGASGRMVGVITHIRELAERMPVRFEVTKEPTTSVVTKVLA